MNLIKAWFLRHFSDPQVVILAMILLVTVLVLVFLGGILTPVLASVVIAYLLEGLVGWTERHRIPRRLGVVLVFSAFLGMLIFALVWLLPVLSRQVAQLVQQLPTMVNEGQKALMELPQKYEVISEEQIDQIILMLRQESTRFGQGVLFMSLEGVRSMITILVYVVLMPLLVFFFLKDKKLILSWITQFMPRERSLTTRIWADVDAQIGNYIRGKVWEILLVWVATYVTFTWLELDFAMLLSMFVGLSVLVPYIGAAVMVIPVAVIAYFDYGGFGRQFVYAVGAYGVIQLLDGNLLAPLLLSEVVNLHPVAIIVAVLVFGGLWGFWGVFFAIPLATVVQAIIKAWPRRDPSMDPEPEPPAEDPSAATV